VYKLFDFLPRVLQPLKYFFFTVLNMYFTYDHVDFNVVRKNCCIGCFIIMCVCYKVYTYLYLTGIDRTIIFYPVQNKIKQ